MIGTGTSRALLAAVGCLLLASCGTAQSSSAPAGAHPLRLLLCRNPGCDFFCGNPCCHGRRRERGGGGLTACGLITEQDATTALGRAAGHGTAGGTAALSECIYDQGALIISMKTDSKALYDAEHTRRGVRRNRRAQHR